MAFPVVCPVLRSSPNPSRKCHTLGFSHVGKTFGPGDGSPTHSKQLESGTKSMSVLKNDSERTTRDANVAK